ncbi:hypothetical protein ELQ35_07720 [Peribacillus cavernae]|uniref:Uncharacterized protein n=1 Tax=Peribacillus cavernae TaxID=1674310 RepID=A0A433HQM5_9BACI|nr:hypothetical protein ELQ35_07720 [Peribacillus cavernae]
MRMEEAKEYGIVDEIIT